MLAIAIGWVLGRLAGGVASYPVLGSHAAYLVFRSLEALAKGRDALPSSKRTTLESLFAPSDIAGDGERVFASYPLAIR